MHHLLLSLVVSSTGFMLANSQGIQPSLTTICSTHLATTTRGECYGRHCGPHNLWPNQITSQCQVCTVSPKPYITWTPEVVACHPWPKGSCQSGFSTGIRVKRTLGEDEGVSKPNGKTKHESGSVFTIPASTAYGTTIAGTTIPGITISPTTVPATIVSVSTVHATTVALTTVPATTIYKTPSRAKIHRPMHSGLDATKCDCSSLRKARLGGCEYFCSQTYDDPTFWHYARSEPKAQPGHDTTHPHALEQDPNADMVFSEPFEPDLPDYDGMVPFTSEEERKKQREKEQKKQHDKEQKQLEKEQKQEKKKNHVDRFCKFKDFFCKAWYGITLRPKEFCRCHHCEAQPFQSSTQD